MALGAYSIIRYANDLSDQRVNLGVLLWHPIDGVRHRLSPFLDRAQAVDPRVRTGSIKQQLDTIISEFQAEGQKAGRDGLHRLAAAFRNGVEVSSPYPAEIFDVDSMLEKLYSELVSPVEEIRRASTQRQFERSLKSGLSTALKHVAPNAAVHDQGLRRLNGIAVELGIRTTAPRLKATWRAVSLQAEDRAADQIAKAKAAALDIATIRAEIADLRDDQQIVAVQPPKPKASEHLKESIAWLGHHADEVLVVSTAEMMVPAIEAALAKMLHGRTIAKK